jgi:hypothetical protein
MYETIYIQIFQEVVHAWNMYIIKSQKPCTHVLGISYNPNLQSFGYQVIIL